MKKQIMAAVFVLAVLISANAAIAKTHRVAIDVTVQRCTPFSCRNVRTTWVVTAVAIGNIGDQEYLVLNHHSFAGTPKTSRGVTEKIVRIHGITVKTPDAGDFVAKLVGTSKVYGGNGDLALLSVKSARRWRSWELLDAKSLGSGLPARGSAVTVEGYPMGRFSRRGANVVGYTKEAGIQTTGLLGQGGSGSAIAYNGKLAGIAWGSMWDRSFGTFATPSTDVIEFVRGKLGRIPGDDAPAGLLSVLR